MDVRIATCVNLPEPDIDESLLLHALREKGIRATLAAWDDPHENWDTPTPTIIRSTWNYYLHHQDFIQWAKRLSSHAPLYNPFSIIQWNTHKGYLAQLEEQKLNLIVTNASKVFMIFQILEK